VGNPLQEPSRFADVIIQAEDGTSSGYSANFANRKKRKRVKLEDSDYVYFKEDKEIQYH
jgi:hypothetical protein